MYMMINCRKKLLFYLFICISACIIFAYFYRIQFTPSSTNNMEFRVVIDPGHGSIDTGTHFQNIYEKNINLSIAKFLKEEFKKVNIIPIMTREEDQLFNNDRNDDLRHRPEIARRNKADLFISLHVNNFPSQSPRGSQIFYKLNSEKSKELAENIKNKLVELNQDNNREILPGNFYVLNKSHCPAILIEAGFLSNPADRKKLTDSSYQKKIAEAIKEGTVNYFQEQMGNFKNDTADVFTEKCSNYDNMQVYYLDIEQFSLKKYDFIYPVGLCLQGNFHKLSNLEILAGALLEQLLNPPAGYISVLPASTKINYIKEENKTLTVDFSKEIITEFNGGAFREYLAVKAIKKTIFSLPEIEELVILIDNKTNQSIGNHIILNRFRK